MKMLVQKFEMKNNMCHNTRDVSFTDLARVPVFPARGFFIYMLQNVNKNNFKKSISQNKNSLYK